MSVAAQLRRVAVKLGLPVSRFLAERVLLARTPLLQHVARAVLARPLRDIDAWLDRDFYLRQQWLPGSRERAARDPALHYALVGHFRSYSPYPGFDPIFYRANHPELGWASDPLGHFARSPQGRAAPTNEIAGLGPLASGAAADTVLTLHHSRGGGSSRFLHLYEEKLASQGHRIVRLERVSPVQPLFQPFDRSSGEPLGRYFNLLEDKARLIELFRTLGAKRLVINHVIDLPPSVLSLVPELCQAASVMFDVILHDYFLVCPRVNLVTDRHFCGEPPVTQCRPCVARNGSELGSVDPVEWRLAAENFARRADRLLAPSQDTARRLSRFWNGLPLEVWEPEDDTTLPLPAPPALAPDEPLKVAVIGGLNVAKGFHVLRKLAKRVKERHAPVRIMLLGQSIDDAGLRRHGVEVHGRYRDADIDSIVQTKMPHIVLQPAIWPESWSFTASIALRHGMPLYAFDIGAVPQRLRRLGRDTVLPLSLAEQPDGLVDRLLDIRAQATGAHRRYQS
jgi:glycosyltransferase involved in cell wall biosynthesis